MRFSTRSSVSCWRGWETDRSKTTGRVATWPPSVPRGGVMSKDNATSRLTRRGFLTTVGVGAAGVAALGNAPAEAAPPPVTLASEMLRVVLTINGREHRLLVEPRWTLLFVLREQLGLTGHQGRLRARRVRRLHGAGGRRAALRLHDPGCRGPGPRDHDPRGPDGRRGARDGAEGLRRARRLPVRLLHAGADHGRRGAAARQPGTRPSTRSASG